MSAVIETRFRSQRNVLRTLLLFVLMGPPIGYFSFVAAALLIGFIKVLFGVQSISQFLDALILFSPLGIFLSYVVGGGQALAAGVTICGYEWFRGKLGILGAVLVGLLVSIPRVYSNLEVLYSPIVFSELALNTVLMSGIIILYHIVPTVVCYRIASRARHEDAHE